MKLLKNRKFQIIIIVIVFITVAVLSINRFSGVNVIRSLVSIPVTWAHKQINNIEELFVEYRYTRKEYAELLDENEALRIENEKLREQAAMLSFLHEENITLRDALLLKDIFDGYNIVGCNIMGSDPGNFVYRYKIDIGTKDAVKIDMPVLAANNTLYGRVLSVEYTTAVITPIIDEKSGISGWISKAEGGYVNVKGDIRYKDKGLCLIENVADNVQIEVGDVIETSGLGGIYPKGILIGTIIEVFADDVTNELYGVLEPYLDFAAISEVFLLMEKVE